MNSNPASKLTPEELLSKIHTGNLLDNLDEAMRAEVLEKRFIERPLVMAEKYGRLTQEKIMKCGYFDIELGRFIRARSVQGAGPGPMGRSGGDGHITIQIANVFYQQSHLIYLWFTGKWPPSGVEVDHIDGDPTNDRLDNLRLVTRSLNHRNKKMQRNNTSGYTGVCWSKTKNKWKARVINKHIGFFNSPEEAHAAREVYITTHPELGFTTRHGR